MLAHYRMFAAYNAWANATLYAAVAAIDEEEYRRDLGAFFRSLEGTLNHLLLADRIWLKRFTGEGDLPSRLDVMLCGTFEALQKARVAEDARLAAYIETLTADDIAGDVTYSPISVPGAITHPLGFALTHMFNHQTHHRGQCHTMLTALGKPSLSLDLIYFVRTDGKRFLDASKA